MTWEMAVVRSCTLKNQSINSGIQVFECFELTARGLMCIILTVKYQVRFVLLNVVTEVCENLQRERIKSNSRYQYNSWEADSHPASQEILPLLWYPKVHYRSLHICSKRKRKTTCSFFSSNLTFQSYFHECVIAYVRDILKFRQGIGTETLRTFHLQGIIML
jgi:hypothetical protein